MKERTWLLKLTDKQFDCIIRGMEFYSRMMSGQVGELRNISKHFPSYELQQRVKQELFPELGPNSSWGWNGNDSGDFFDIEIAQSYQIYREMLHQITLFNNVENVYTSETLHTNKADKLIVERIK